MGGLSEPPAEETLHRLPHLSLLVCKVQLLQLILQAVVRAGTGEPTMNPVPSLPGA